MGRVYTKRVKILHKSFGKVTYDRDNPPFDPDDVIVGQNGGLQIVGQARIRVWPARYANNPTLLKHHLYDRPGALDRRE